ncbi:Chaperone protein DnaJ [Glycine soja]|nr:Chaperone protein DnaJ [Glycine soja]
MQYHPDVSKDPQAAELFKSIHDAYKVLSNEAARVQYDQELQFGHKPYREKWSYGPEFEDQARFYSETDEEEDEVVDLDEERGSLVEVLRSAFVSLFLLQTPGSRFSLTFSSLTALFDKKLDTGYKMGYIITWILGGRGGILLTLCLLVASWVCGKTVVAFVVVAIWVGSYLARYAPLPQGALLALLYMSIKLQSDLI